MKNKENIVVPTIPHSALTQDPRLAKVIEGEQPLPTDFSGLSGRVTRVRLNDGRVVTIKMPNPDSPVYRDMVFIDLPNLDRERKRLQRLSTLQGNGVVRLFGELNWRGERGLVKEWVIGKKLCPDLTPAWGEIERGTKAAGDIDIEAARLVLSFFDVLDKIHQRKVALGDIKFDDIIWDGTQATAIDFGEDYSAEYNSKEKMWEITNPRLDPSYRSFNEYIRNLELPDMLETMFLQFTSLGRDRISDVNPFQMNQEQIARVRNSILRHIAQKTINREYKTAQEVRTDIFLYFVSIKFPPERLKLSSQTAPGETVRLTPEEVS